MAETKPGIKFKTVDEYVKALPAAVRPVMNELRETIKEAAPGVEEVISYNIPAYRLHGMLIYVAAWKEHIGMYPKGSLMREFGDELARYDDGSPGTLKFPLGEPLPLGLIGKMIRFRVRENKEAAERKKKA